MSFQRQHEPHKMTRLFPLPSCLCNQTLSGFLFHWTKLHGLNQFVLEVAIARSSGQPPPATFQPADPEARPFNNNNKFSLFAGAPGA